MKRALIIFFMISFLIGCSHQLYKRMVVVEEPANANIERDMAECTNEAKTGVGEEIGRQLVNLFLPMQTSFNNRIDRRYKTCMENRGYIVRRKLPGEQPQHGYGYNE